MKVEKIQNPEYLLCILKTKQQKCFVVNTHNEDKSSLS